MATNFDFLKDIDKNLFDIISDAEKLYRDEYFEQCMTQTRRFGEHLCKNVLGNKRTEERTFDDMLATLKDCISGEEQEKEFVEDLYFLKKHGNESVHAGMVKQDGVEALECLQRAFEASLSYAIYHKKASSDLINLHYDIDLLMTGKRSKKNLSGKYQKVRLETENKMVKTKKILKKQTKNKDEKQYHSMPVSKAKKSDKGFWIFVGITFVISFLLLLFLAFV